MSTQAWTDANRQILDALDLRSEYLALGLRLDGAAPSSSGWLPAFAFGADEKNASAGVCVAGEHPQKGRYKEFTGECRNLSFFEFAVVAGRFPDWQDARKFYSKQTGVKLPRGPKPKGPEDSLVFRDWNEALVRAWCLTKPPIAHWAVRIAGGKLAAWPASSQKYVVVALPVFGAQGVNDDPCGWVMWNKTGKPLPLFKGKGLPPEPKKVLVAGGSKAGWMNRYALSRIEKAKVVWKVEGPPDMLALQSVIPREFLADHVVVTNSGGAKQLPTEDSVAMFAGKVVYVVGDTDRDGLDGGLRWAMGIAEVAAEVRYVRLPYEVTPDHGKDLRDWLLEDPGHTYQKLLSLAESGEVITGGSAGGGQVEQGKASSNGQSNGQASGSPSLIDPKDPLAFDKVILEELGLDVLGEHEDRSVEVFSGKMGKSDLIQTVGRLRFEDLLQICGEVARSKVNQGMDMVPGTFHVNQVKEAIAVMAAQRRIANGATLGQGIWLGTEGEVVLVGAGEAAVWNGSGQLHRIYKPRAAGLLLDINSSEKWYCYDRLNEYLTCCKEDPEWSRGIVRELFALYDKWFWKSKSELIPQLAAGLVLATWLQTIWEWRPLVSIIGESSCGKSNLFESTASLFGQLGLYSQKPSEPGLRQAIRNRAVAVLVDEFENDKHRKAILELLRTSGRGGKQLRGTVNQRGVVYGLKHICWVTAVEVGLAREPDRNRFILLELDMPPKEKHGALDLPTKSDLESLGQKLLAVAVFHSQKAREIATRIKNHRFPNIHARVVESFSVPVAMLAATFGLDEMKLLEHYVDAVINTETTLSDQEELMQAIFSSTIFLAGGQKATVSQILSMSSDFPDAWENLEGCGVAVVSQQRGPRRPQTNAWERDSLFLYPHSVKRYLLKGTKWEDQEIIQMLARLPGAVREQKSIAHARQSGISVPWEYVQKRFLHGSEERDLF